MQQKYGRNHFDFLSDSFTIPEEREALVAAMERRPDSYWIVKPPGGVIKGVALLPMTFSSYVTHSLLCASKTCSLNLPK